ncbi:MAG: putative DNA-binding domain-containing protein [Gammaproteobacteria bacterium]|nr:putative DNA-binding domain-containing protein [Gammaproteobacteria bacterium]
MLSLPELQRQFASAIVDAHAAAQHESLWHDTLLNPGRLTAYRNNFRINIEDALAAIYPVVRRLVGDEFFAAMTRIYAGHAPSRSGNIHHFGAHLPEFLRGFAPTRPLPYLPDVARLELAYHQAFHAGAGAPLSDVQQQRIAAGGYADLMFTMQPALRLLRSDYPALRIWLANRADSDEVPTIDLNAGGDRLLIYRHLDEVEITRLDEPHYRLLALLAAGHRVGTLLNAVSGPSAISRVIQFGLQRQLFSELMIIENTP